MLEKLHQVKTTYTERRTESESAAVLTHADARFQSEKERKSFTATIYAASVPQPGHPNEDAFFGGRLPGAPLAAVFDGQGSAEGAAKKAVRQLERLYTDSRSKLDWMKTAKLLDSHLLGANKSTMVAASLALAGGGGAGQRKADVLRGPVPARGGRPISLVHGEGGAATEQAREDREMVRNTHGH